MPDHPLKIYISHASQDQSTADTLFRRLTNEGFETWLCEISVKGASKWREEMDIALKSADVFLYCISEHSTSRQGQFVGELERALELHKTDDNQLPAILPLRLDPSAIPDSLGMFMAVDYFSSEGYERLLDALHNLVLKSSRCVISIHGIKTRGKWQKDIVPLLGKAGFVPIPLDYGYFLALQLLFTPSRSKKIEWFRDEYTRQCDRVRVTRPSIIAHSLGSYIVAGAIAKYPEIKFDRIILCGAIVDRSYSWDTYIQSGNVRAVLNQYGGNDFWARVVEWAVPDAGQSGLRGFDNPALSLTQQYRPKFGHSDYFYDLNYRETWIPFLQGHAIKPGTSSGPIISNWQYMITRLVVLFLLVSCVATVTPFLTSPQTPKLATTNNLLFLGKEIALTSLPPQMLQPLANTDQAAALRELATRESLTLDNTTIVVGSVGAGIAATLTVNNLTMINGSRIVTNGNTFRLEAAHITVSNGAIISFKPEDLKPVAASIGQTGVPGHDGGRVFLAAYDGLSGALRLSLPGQHGGDGGQGSPGEPYTARAQRGNDGVDGVGCLHGGTDGATGATGRQGHPGAQGGSAGHGGTLGLSGRIVAQRNLITFAAPAGNPGDGGMGGDGGPGQQGGEGGSGSRFCGGGHGGSDGQKGSQGEKGPMGRPAVAGKVEVTEGF